ncbi:MAG: sigma 54-interacting transcriptional regulator, partial [Planctomycetales bacterium]
MNAYLEMTMGNNIGAVYRLDEQVENRIGRGLECAVVLTDPLCSRVHATIKRDDDGWVLWDASSRNGSYVNGQKVEGVVLAEACRIRVGSTEFVMHLGTAVAEADSDQRHHLTQTIIKDQLINPDTGSYPLVALSESKQADKLLVLYQLSIKLLGCGDPDEVVHIALDLIHDHVAAAVVGFLWATETGQLLPRMVVPEQSDKQIRLSASLTELVCQQGHAVWIANLRGGKGASDSVQHFADALCVPLFHEGALRGAIHVYRENERFDQGDFDFSVSVANILGTALVRARRESTLEADLQQLAAKSPGYDEMIGDCTQMKELKSKIHRLAHTTGCVLIMGESGTGKELVARAIQRGSPRADQSFLSVNCAAISVDLIESQLFGHTAGAFTGADRDHSGLFEQADLGTLFLDEVGELSLAGQAKLLRILEGHPFLPVGGSTEVSVDVRVIAATNINLEAYVRDKRFREDLYYRLCGFELNLPALRDRGEDIGLLIDSFLHHYRQQ